MSLLDRYEAEEKQKKLKIEYPMKQLPDYEYICSLADAVLEKEGHRAPGATYMLNYPDIGIHLTGVVYWPHNLTFSEEKFKKPMKVLDIVIAQLDMHCSFDAKWLQKGDTLYHAVKYDDGHIEVEKCSPGEWIGQLEELCRKHNIGLKPNLCGVLKFTF
jgi:hypothetical protein